MPENTFDHIELETRIVPVEFRVDDEGIIEGYAAVFNQWSQDLGYFREKIRQGAFKKTIKESDIRALFNHDPNYVLGRNKADTLELAEDQTGLRFKVEPPEATWANDLQESIKRGDINQGSFAFKAIRDEWNHDADPIERELIELRLFDVSVVTYPAYEQTKVAARSLGKMFIGRVQQTGNLDEVDHMLEQLKVVIANSEPGQESHSEEDQADEESIARSLAIRRRRVELEELKLF
jgi:HK97 family phage prohead protease